MEPVPQPLISVITVVFNARDQLERTILSVLAQDYQEIDWIIIDGGSVDGTVELIRKYEDKVSYWISQPDNGVYDAMNKALEVCKGDWVYFLGAGDLLLNVLHKVASRFTDPSAVYYGNVYKCDTASVYDGKFSAFKLAVHNICHQAIFYPAAVFKKYRYNTKYRMQADHNLNLQCYGDNNFKFEYLPLLICIYEGGGYSAVQLDLPFFADKLEIVRSNLPAPVYWYVTLRRKIARMIRRRPVEKG